jgi:hypothetical protein
MGELAVIPIRLSMGQAALLCLIVAGLVAAVLAMGLLEGALASGLSLLLRLAGRPPPQKGAIGMALDEIEARLERRERAAGGDEDRPDR